MKKYVTFVSIFFFLVLGSAMLPWVVHAQSATAPLRLGDVLPDVSGQTPSGGSLHLSEAVASKTAVVVFSFSKDAGKDARVWNDHLFKDYGSQRSVAVFTVLMLESAPRFLRGIIASRFKSSMPPYMQDSTIMCYQDEELWKRRLAVADDRHAYVLLLGSDGHILWRNSGAFDNAGYTELKNKVLERHH